MAGLPRILRSLLSLCLAMALAQQSLAAASSSDADPIARLQAQIDAGKTHLQFDEAHGWLQSVLDELKIPISSQGLVFSKTSFQPSKISPQTPRAVYFNDDVYIGWVHNGTVLEAASVDPKQGTVFYSLAQKKSDRPRFVRETASCMQCHESQSIAGGTDLLMRSVYADSDGMPIFSAGTYVTTEQSSLRERWGGWYADGKFCGPSMANAIAGDSERPDHLSPLEREIDKGLYLSSHSDVVALLVLAHQTHLHNLLAQAGAETRKAIADDELLKNLLGSHPGEHSDSYELRLKAACEPVVQAMLFSGEAPLGGNVEGSTDFAQSFAKRGLRDNQGRSLRDFDLKTRLFKYPCSYLIYSQQFDDLPDPARQYIYRRLWQVLTGRDDSAAFNCLSDETRDSIYQILYQTKDGLPAYWKAR